MKKREEGVERIWGEEGIGRGRKSVRGELHIAHVIKLIRLELLKFDASEQKNQSNSGQTLVEKNNILMMQSKYTRWDQQVDALFCTLLLL